MEVLLYVRHGVTCPHNANQHWMFKRTCKMTKVYLKNKHLRIAKKILGKKTSVD